MVVCVFEHVHWRFVLNGRLSPRLMQVLKILNRTIEEKIPDEGKASAVRIQVGLCRIVTLQYSSTTLYQVSYHIR
jgi:hypothetical protein